MILCIHVFLILINKNRDFLNNQRSPSVGFYYSFFAPIVISSKVSSRYPEGLYRIVEEPISAPKNSCRL